MAGEKLFENKIKKYLDSKGEDVWYVKFYANKFTRSGVPDLLINYKGYPLAMEVKGVDGTFTDGDLQPLNIRKFNKARGIAGVLIPTEGKERFRRYIERNHPDYIDTPIYDFDDFKKILDTIDKSV